MRGLDEIFKSARQIYDGRVRGSTPESIISDCLIKIQDITQYCLVKLAGRDVSSFDVAHTGGKRYCILESNGQLSRPILKSLFEFQPEAAVANLQALFNSKSPATRSYTLSGEATAKALYSAVMSFSVCYDLWKPSSRKTPGTYFELVLGSLLAAVLPGHKRLKHIPLAGLEDDPSNESVSTDIVFQKGTQQSGLVVADRIIFRKLCLSWKVFQNRPRTNACSISSRERVAVARKSEIPVDLTDEQRKFLEQLVRVRTAEHRRVVRARALL